MDNLGDLFGGLGDMLGDLFGDAAGDEAALGLGALFGATDRRRDEAPRIVYERYLCGGARELNINDR